jgi:hypothetical protein
LINTSHVMRATTYIALSLFLIVGCSGGGGVNPIVPASPGDMIGHPTQSGGGDVRRAIPAFSWTLNEPADLYEEGWGQIPATIATSFTFSATLGGTKSDWFDGKIFFSIDGEPRHFSFSNKVITADISGLEPGIHNVYLLAASAQGEAGRSFEFEVLDRPPSMQVGIGIDDGKLHISPDRPMPTSQLGDLSRWSVEGFLAEKRDIEVLPGNDEVVIGLTDERSFNDYMMYEPVGISPTVTFNSTLGEMTCKLFNDERQGGRHAQSGCTWGQLLPLDECNDAVDGWTFDLQHFTSKERERREALYMLVDEGYVEGCFYTGKYSDSWSSCFNYVIVNYNWFWEGHLDPEDNWDAQYDTVEYDAGNCGYKGVGYRNGRWEHYDRYRGYFPPSICGESRHQWEVIIDCNNCNGGYTFGYKSKGWIWGEDLEVDSTCPEFDEIIAIPGEMLNDYVADTLINDLMGEGEVWRADHADEIGDHEYARLWQYYDERCGQLMDDWILEHPGGICFVVKAHDPVSDQGRWIGHMLSIDLEDKDGIRTYLDDEQIHFFYVDKEELADAEFADDGDDWPIGSGCSNPLPADGSPQGELSCWIIRADCVGEYYNSARFRIKDDCSNWTRSENMVPEDQRSGQSEGSAIEISPAEGTTFNYDDPVTFTASITGGDYVNLMKSIDWEILTTDYKSVLAPDTAYIGDKFSFEHIRDCELEVRAHIFYCDKDYECIRKVNIDASITIEVEPGPYWIDGPSVPIYDGGEGDWHETGYSMAGCVLDTPSGGCGWTGATRLTEFRINQDYLLIGQINTRISFFQCPEYFEIWINNGLNNGENEWLEVPRTSVSELGLDTPEPGQPWLWEWQWDISEMYCRQHTIIVKGFASASAEDPISVEQVDGIDLEVVTPDVILEAAEMYIGDGYLFGGSRCPGYNKKFADFYLKGSVDCSNFISQLLIRLGRKDRGTNNRFTHHYSQWWKGGGGCVAQVNNKADIKHGDIIVKPKHVFIFNKWENSNTKKTIITLESSRTIPGVGSRTRRWSNKMTAWTWVIDENNVFKPCNDGEGE